MRCVASFFGRHLSVSPINAAKGCQRASEREMCLFSARTLWRAGVNRIGSPYHVIQSNFLYLSVAPVDPTVADVRCTHLSHLLHFELRTR